MSTMQAQTRFCPNCYSDDYEWADGEYRIAHGRTLGGALCPMAAHERMSVPTEEET